MNSFTISQVAQFSGVKPHTLRTWEKRYDAVDPNRSEGNTRYYNNAQLRRLLNIVSLRDSGYKVSELSALPDDKLFELVTRQKERSLEDPEEYFVSQLLAAGIDYDETHFEKIFSHCVIRYGLKSTYKKVIQPLLERIGLMWTSNRLPPSHEHYISNLIRRKLMTAADSSPPPQEASDSWLLFLPEDEFHEIGLLFAQYLLRHRGQQVFYLGANVPMESLAAAVEDTEPSNLLLFLVRNDLPAHTGKYLDELRGRFSNQKIHVAGNRERIEPLKNGRGIEWLYSADDLEQLLQTSD